jgi:ankyrin repeat protein
MKEKDGIINYKNNYIEIFDELIKIINSRMNLDEYKNNFEKQVCKQIIFNNREISIKIYEKLSELYSQKNNLLLIKNKYGNNLPQYFLSLGLIPISLEIINIYFEIFSNIEEGDDNFIQLLLDKNNEGKNIFESGIYVENNIELVIDFYSNIFSLLEKIKSENIYKILDCKNEDNIFIRCIKEENVSLFLLFFEKLKKYYPSTNILDKPNNYGQTPLHFSCVYVNKDIATMLMILNCNVNSVDIYGNSPLHYAVKGGDISIVKKLIYYGANKSLKNKDNKTPKDYAEEGGKIIIKNYFSWNPIYSLSEIKGVRNDRMFLALYAILVFIKLFIYNQIWESIILDIMYLLYFLYSVKPIFYCHNKKDEKKYSDDSFEKLFMMCKYDEYIIKKICPKCKTFRSLKTVHCIVCDLCIEDFDHHCYYLNKCITKKNLKFFLLFMILFLIYFIINLYLLVLAFMNSEEDNAIKLYHYIKKGIILMYILILTFGIWMVILLLFERIKGKIFSKMNKFKSINNISSDDNGKTEAMNINNN